MSGTTTPTYDLDAEAQLEIVALSMWDSDFLRRTEGLIKPAYFSDDIEAGFIELATGFYAKYREAPSPAAWKELVKDAFRAKPPLWRDDLKADVVEKLRETARMTVRSKAFLLDKIVEFARQQETMNALIAAANLVGKSADPDRFKKVETRMKEAFAIGLHDGDEDYDYWERIEERTQERLDIAAGAKPKTGVTTGIRELDELLKHGGWGRGELSGYMGPAKIGKSFFLGFSAMQANLAGYNVLFISLENSIEVASDRFDAQVADISMSDFLKSPHTINGNISTVAKSGKPGVLKIRKFATGTFKPRDLERILEDYQTKGVEFDLVAVDYLDIMASDTAFDSTIDTSKHIYTRVRGIAGTYRTKKGNAAFLSATQTNREGAKAAVANMTQVAEDFNRIRIVDLMIGINRTEDEKRSGEARLNLVASRNQSDGPTLFIKQNLSKGKAVEEVTAVE